jgi:hypothetical protein
MRSVDDVTRDFLIHCLRPFTSRDMRLMDVYGTLIPQITASCILQAPIASIQAQLTPGLTPSACAWIRGSKKVPLTFLDGDDLRHPLDHDLPDCGVNIGGVLGEDFYIGFLNDDVAGESEFSRRLRSGWLEFKSTTWKK